MEREMTDLPAYDPNAAADLRKRAIFSVTLSLWAYHRTFRIPYAGNCAGIPPPDFLADRILDRLNGEVLLLRNSAGETLEVSGDDIGDELTADDVENCITGVRFQGFEDVRS